MATDQRQKRKILILTACAAILILVGAIIFGRGPKGRDAIKEVGLLKVQTPKTYDQPLVLATLDYTLAIAPVEARNVAAEMIGDGVIKYVDAYEATDVEQVKYNSKLKESIILKAEGHPDKFVYQIDTENYEWTKDGEGNIIVSSKTAKPKAIPASDGIILSEEQIKKYAPAMSRIFRIPKPFMNELGSDVRGEVKSEIVGNKLILTPDSQWIHEHHYPIVIDPTVEKLPQIKEEIADKRTIGSLTFLNDDDSFTTMAHIGQINYRDRQTGELKPIDTRLEDKGSDWEQDKASYALSLPKFADQWIKFTDLYEGKNQMIEMRAMADHTPGQLVTDQNDPMRDRKIIYPNAFGQNYDLELTSSNVSFSKVVKIKERPTDLSNDLTFEFELNLPKDMKVKTAEGDWDNKSARKTKKQVKLGTSAGSITYLQDFIAWDSRGLAINIDVEISEKGGKTILKKIIPKDFLVEATYPVYTDATVSYYTGAGDGGMINRTTADWSGCRSASSSYYAADYTGTAISTYSETDTGQNRYYIGRSFWPIDTSALPDDATVSTAIFYGYATYLENGDNDGYDYIVLLAGTQADTASLVQDDFDQCGSTAGSATVDVSNMTTSNWSSWTLNATGRGWISKTGYTKLCMREGHDLDNQVPANYAKIQAQLATSESANDPYLSIYYPSAPTATTVTDTPDPTNPGRSVSFIYDWNDDAGDTVKIKICKTDSLTNQNCDGGYWASSTDFTTNDPAVVTYNVAAEDAGQTRNYWAFACDNGGLCTSGTAGTFSVNSQSTVPNIKVRGGLRVR